MGHGIQVGGQEGWDTKRVYKVPPERCTKAPPDRGRRTRHRIGRGMWGKADEKNLKLADGTLIVMDTQWRYKISAPLSQTGGMAHAPWLKESGCRCCTTG